MEQTQKTSGGWMRALKAALPATIPVMTGYICLSIAYGILMAANGYGPVWSVLASLLVFAGSMQYAAVDLLVTVFNPVQAFLLAFMVNARHIFYGLGVLDKYKGLGKLRAYLIYTLTDETFSLVTTLEPPQGVERKPFYFWLSLLNHLFWVSGTLVGAVAGSLITFETAGMDFALTALFVVLFLEQWKKKENRISGIIGIVCAGVSLAVFGAENLVIPAMILVMTVLLRGRKYLCI